MWQVTCRNCRWTSGNRIIKNAAEILGRLHEEDDPGHAVELKEVSTFKTGTESPEPAEDCQ